MDVDFSDLDPTIISRWEAIAKQEKERVLALGQRIGFGRMMQLATECWREENARRGAPAGAEHVTGPCAVFVVPCGCESGMCDWCCGSRWLTKTVKAARDAQQLGEPR